MLPSACRLWQQHLMLHALTSCLVSLPFFIWPLSFLSLFGSFPSLFTSAVSSTLSLSFSSFPPPFPPPPTITATRNVRLAVLHLSASVNCRFIPSLANTPSLSFLFLIVLRIHSFASVLGYYPIPYSGRSSIH
ncbi:hypothetical protein DFP73DRAFT_401359 [Morchella snyderi]|nr:hypothetical protein DFP73DRAFT_401359 [Morchella snyderi]